MRYLLFAATMFAPVLAHAATTTTVDCSGLDDTFAINQALASYDTVYLQPGVCAISSALQIQKSNTTLFGAGQAATVIRSLTPNSFNMIEIGRQLGQQIITQIMVSGLTLDGTATAGDDSTANSSGMIVSSFSTYVGISNVEVKNQSQSGIVIHGSHVVVTGASVHDNFHGGIYIAGNAHFSPRLIYADYDQVLNSVVAHNSLERPPPWEPTHPGVPAWDGIDFDPLCSNGSAINNTVVNNDILLFENLPGDTWWSGPYTVTNNRVVNSQQSGIDVTGNINGFTVTGNTLANDVQKSISVGVTATNGVVSGNTVIQGGKITIDPNAMNVKAKGNVIR